MKSQILIALDKIVAFVVTTRPEQATVFYRDQLGFKLVQDDFVRAGL